MVREGVEGIWLVCAHHEVGMLKRIFGERYKIVKVGAESCLGMHCGLVITEWAHAECMSSTGGQEWLDRMRSYRGVSNE